MFTTTVLIALQMRYVKHLPIIISIMFLGFFGSWMVSDEPGDHLVCASADVLSGLFWGASLKKIPHGAWVPLTIGIVL
jgi:KUP system potassium uptake protein